MSIKVIGPALPNMPFEKRPQNNSDIIWRYSANPVIRRNELPSANSIFNSAVVPFDGGFAGVFRCDARTREMRIHAGFSRDGLNWDIAPDRIRMADGPAAVLPFEFAYDPRVCFIEDRYYVTWCNGYCDYPTIGLAWTRDFKEFHQLENAFLPFNRNGVLFPRKINGKYMMLSRPSDNGHTPFGDIFLSQSPDLTYWGEHRLVMKTTRQYPWQSTKIGAGPVPIETSEGWLLFYHGVLTSCSGFVYSWGAALLDLDEPWRVIARSKEYLLSPQTLYECVGDVPNVTFPCAALADSATGRIAVYYGCADTVTGLAFGHVDEIIDHIRN